MSGAFADMEAGLRREQLARRAARELEETAGMANEVMDGAPATQSGHARLDGYPSPTGRGDGDGLGPSYAEDDEPLLHVSTSDLVRYGLEPEFVGRIPVRVACRTLRQEDLVRVLTEVEGSVLGQMKADFEGYGIELEVTEAALHEIARQAAEQQSGARGLVTVLERTLRDFKFELPSTPIERLVLCEEAVRAPKQKLQQLISEWDGDATEKSR